MPLRKRRPRIVVVRRGRSTRGAFLLAFAGAVVGSLMTLGAVEMASEETSTPHERVARVAETPRERADAQIMSKCEPPVEAPAPVSPPPVFLEMKPARSEVRMNVAPPSMNPMFL